MKVAIHMACYNEAALLEAAVRHYRTRFPEATFHIWDNHSTDDSVDIARRLGCQVSTWGPVDVFDVLALTHLQNNAWKSESAEWVIMCDVDEWICITEDELREEDQAGATIVRTHGYNMVGDSKTTDLSDICPDDIQAGVYSRWYSKRLIFNAMKIGELNSVEGSHWCAPTGTCIDSTYVYVLKHMDFLGKEYKIEKNRRSYNRSKHYREMGSRYCSHHEEKDDAIARAYDQLRLEAAPIVCARVST
jgi:glycosyltransferase involved in cell wall biosynthesis